MAADDDELLRAPIFIVGAPRSGTAILAHILRADSDLAYVREPRLVWRYGNDTKSDALQPSDARPEVVAHIRSTFAREVRAQGRRRLLEKLPSNSLRIPFVRQVFPDARIVHIRRHGPDAIAAIQRRWQEPPKGLRAPAQRDRLVRHFREAAPRQYLHYARELIRQASPIAPRGVAGVRTWGPRLPGFDGLVRDLDLLEVCALQWRTCVELATYHGRQLPAGEYFECSVEALDPEVIRHISELFQLNDVDQMLGAMDDEYDRARILPRADALSDEARRRVMAWIEPTLRWLELDGGDDWRRASAAVSPPDHD
jgi:hypothetical protein